METALYNKNSIHMTRALYPERFFAAIVTSVIPMGRTAEAEVARLLEIDRSAERVYGVSYNITEISTDFGPTIGLKIKDVAPVGKDGPFPLACPIYAEPLRPIQSMSVHRLFVRGLNRFEIAVIQMASQPATEEAESEMTARLTAFADKLPQSLQGCMATVPLPLSKQE